MYTLNVFFNKYNMRGNDTIASASGNVETTRLPAALGRLVLVFNMLSMAACGDTANDRDEHSIADVEVPAGSLVSDLRDEFAAEGSGIMDEFSAMPVGIDEKLSIELENALLQARQYIEVRDFENARSLYDTIAASAPDNTVVQGEVQNAYALIEAEAGN